MAKINNNQRGSNLQIPGTMSQNKLQRFKLHMNSLDTGENPASFRRIYRHNRGAKAIFQAVKAYRQFVHDVRENRLPSSLRLGIHYMLAPLSRSSSGARDNSSSENMGDNPQNVPMAM